MVTVSSWGRLTADEHEVFALADAARALQGLPGARPGVAHGMGRSYGDVCLNPGGSLWRTTGMDRFLGFDPVNGRLSCESGVLLRDIQKMAVPRGWMLPVTPGTQMVTVGGAIANDVHGKNHHVHGSFGDHVLALQLLRTDGSVIDCGPHLLPQWLAATIGGMGLTGVILRVQLQLRRVAGPWLETETLPYENLAQFFALSDESEAQWEHTVSWIDCMAGSGARGLFMRGKLGAASLAAAPSGRKHQMPFVPPVSLMNRWSLPVLNTAYYHLNKWKAPRRTVHYETFNYPLDNLLDWNRMYGPRGFYQYQSVVPRAVGHDAVQAMLAAIARAGEGSFLAVLKTFGERQSAGMLSFPQPGVTLALDFPNRGDGTLALFSRLDSIVAEAGGRLYPAKDARMPRALFEAGYPRLPEFLPYRDPGISSAMSRRLMGC